MPQIKRRALGSLNRPCPPFLPEGPESEAAWQAIEAEWGDPLNADDRAELRDIVHTYLSLEGAAEEGPEEAMVRARLDEIARTADRLMRLLQPPPNPSDREWETTQKAWAAINGVTLRKPHKTGHHELWTSLLSFGEVCIEARRDLEDSPDFWVPNMPWQIFVSQLASFSQYRGNRPTASKGGQQASKVLEWQPSPFVGFVWAIQSTLPAVPFKLHLPYSLTACGSAVAKVLEGWRAGRERG